MLILPLISQNRVSIVERFADGGKFVLNNGAAIAGWAVVIDITKWRGMGK